MLVKTIFKKTTLGSMIVLSGIISTPTLAYEAGDIIVRVGAAQAEIETDAEALELNGTVAGLGSAEVADDTQIGITATHMFNSSLGIELLASTPFEHEISGNGPLAGLDIADVKQLPPTISAVVYFNEGSKFQPYLGAGINYTTFFDEKLTSDADAAFLGLGLTGGDIELKDSWGIAFQAGADYQITPKWHLNASVRWIEIYTTAEVTFDDGSVVSTDVELDPYVYTVAVGYTF